jgi:hypothetical protein
MISARARSCKECGRLHRLFGDYCATCKEIMTGPLIKNFVGLKDHRQSFVYAVGVTGDSESVVKFGFTKALDDRLRAIQVGSPVRLEFVAKDFGAKEHEKAIHALLAADRLHGEWFSRSTKAQEVISAMNENRVAALLGLKDGRNLQQKSPFYVLNDMGAG